MTRTMLAACAIGAFAASTTIGAQTPPPPKPQPSTPSMGSQTDKDTVTVTGCLKAWENSGAAMGTPTTPSPTGAMAATKFMLTNIEPDGAATKPATPPATSATSTAAAQHYVVMADSGVNLSAHLNHKVRIAGKKMAHDAKTTMRPDPSKPAEPRPDPSKPSAGIMSGEQAHKDLGTITASSVTMISATCPGVTN